MAQITCPECKEQISDAADNCPKCEYKLTSEEAVKLKKKQITTTQPGCIAVLGVVVILGVLFILSLIVVFSYPTKTEKETGTWRRKNEVLSDPAKVRTLPQKQEQTTGNEAWLGRWSLESIGSRSTGQHLAGSLQSDIFISWNWTFYADGQFESKLIQDTGQGIITTTASGTYQVSGDMYETMLNEAIMSMGETSVPIPNVTSHQIGTWSRTGETLSIIPAGSPTKVFKRIY